MRPIPDIKILYGLPGASRARGVAVVIDVLRAFSTVCFIAAAGARRLLTVADVDTARQMKPRHPGAILVGERDGFRLDGFELGNSPTRVHTVDWQGRTAILTTTNGTSGLAAARAADQVLTGSFVNAGAVIRHIQHVSAANVSLVCMGSAGRPALEDSLCAQYLQDALAGKSPDFQAMKASIMKSPEAARFLDGQHCEDLPPQDLALCLDLNRFDFVLQAEKVCSGVIELTRTDR